MVKLKDLIERRFSDNSDLSISSQKLIEAWIVGSSAPSYDDKEILSAIIAYGDARVKELKNE